MSDASGKLYYRASSGLVREFSALDTFIFNTLGYSLGLVLASAPTFLGGLYPQASVYVVLTLGVVLALFNGLTYGLFAAAMPRSGGDYVYITRALSPSLGFAANWGFSWSQFLGLGVYTAGCVTDALVPGLTTLGSVTGSRSLVEAGSGLNREVWVWGTGTVLLLVVLLISVAGMGVLKRFLNVFFVVALAGTLCMLGVLWGASREDFVREFDRFMAANANLPDAYQAVIRMGEAKGLQTGQPTDFLSAVLALPVGYWVFIGFTYSVYVGGEVKEPQKSQTRAILAALLTGYVLYMVIMGRYYAVVGRDFNNAVALIKDDPNSPLGAGTSMNFMAGLLTKNVLLNALISLSTFLWYFLLLFVMAALCVRNLSAWSIDHLMPAGLGRPWKGTWVRIPDWIPIGGKFDYGANEKEGDKVPPPDVKHVWVGQGVFVAATVSVVVLAEAFLALHAFFKLAFINYIALFSVCFLITGVAAVAFPYRRPAFFAAAPGLVRRRVAGVPLIVIAGVGNIVLFAIVLYSSLTNPGVSGVQGALPTVLLVVIYGSGFAIFYLANALGRRAGRPDLRELYGQIPPE
jgi:amino acid transporter